MKMMIKAHALMGETQTNVSFGFCGERAKGTRVTENIQADSTEDYHANVQAEQVGDSERKAEDDAQYSGPGCSLVESLSHSRAAIMYEVCHSNALRKFGSCLSYHTIRSTKADLVVFHGHFSECAQSVNRRIIKDSPLAVDT